ncbi:hypothetical protein [Microcoleus sp. D2_18a_B4]
MNFKFEEVVAGWLSFDDNALRTIAQFRQNNLDNQVKEQLQQNN